MALSNSQFDAIMRVYSQRQFLNKRRQDERIREVYERIPQVEALTDEIAAAMAQAARRKLLGDEDGARAFKEEASLLKEQKRKYMQRAGYPDDYMEMQYHCPCCRDTGFADGKKCRCFRQMEIQVLYDQSNIREVLERENFDTLSMEYYDRERIDSRVGMTVYDYMSMVIGECRAYVENFGREKGSILFTGSTGCGKTFLSNCIARELLRQCYSVVYLTATNMFDILSESRFGGRDGEEVRDRAAYILDCDLLIIDDLGTELINTFTASQLFYCINERLTKKLGTIISTNLALSRMQDEFTERVTSRIMSQYKVLPLLGEDLRLLRRGYGKQG